MEPEKIGVLATIEDVRQNPDKYTGIIARMMNKLSIHGIREMQREGKPLSICSLKALSKPKLQTEELEVLK
jgi:hypothetical protein